jgi:hypothetical protein
LPPRAFFQPRFDFQKLRLQRIGDGGYRAIKILRLIDRPYETLRIWRSHVVEWPAQTKNVFDGVGVQPIGLMQTSLLN